MRLRFGRAGTDGSPGHQIAKILRRYRIERLGASGQAKLGYVVQKPSGQFHAFGDVERIVHIRIVDVALPAGGSARFLKIDAHDDKQRVGHVVGERFQATGVVEPGSRVMDRAGADHNEQSVILAIKHVAQRLTALPDRFYRLVRERHVGVNVFGRRHGVETGDVDVFDVRQVGERSVGECHGFSCFIISRIAATRSAKVGQLRTSVSLSCPARR